MSQAIQKATDAIWKFARTFHSDRLLTDEQHARAEREVAARVPGARYLGLAANAAGVPGLKLNEGGVLLLSASRLRWIMDGEGFAPERQEFSSTGEIIGPSTFW